MDSISGTYGRDLNLNLLRVFVVVAEEGSLTRAASRLYVTQPAISASMRRLATFVGTELVVRQGYGVVLTTRGVELLAAARVHLGPLVAATMAAPAFEPSRSTATIRVGLADCLEVLVLPRLLVRLRAEAPNIQVVVVAVQFRTVEELLLKNEIDFAVTVADELPRTILRQPLGERHGARAAFMCLYDPRFAKLKGPLSKAWYFAQEHVIVSYAGDVRGIVEDSLGLSRRVRASVPAFGYVPDVVEGSALVGTVPRHFASHVVRTRPHLRAAPLPFAIEGATLELLWSRATDTDAAAGFVRGLIPDIVRALDAAPLRAGQVAARARA